MWPPAPPSVVTSIRWADSPVLPVLAGSSSNERLRLAAPSVSAVKTMLPLASRLAVAPGYAESIALTKSLTMVVPSTASVEVMTVPSVSTPAI